MPDGHQETLTLTNLPSMAGVAKEEWDRLALGGERPYYPFASWDFLDALEVSGSVRPETGWGPHHLLLRRGEHISGVMPLYLKAHSRGEFVFDHAWADAYERAGGRYYPKLLGAIPFTPATGLRLFGETAEDEAALLAGARQITSELGVSSLHINFLTEEEKALAEAAGYLVRTGTQYRFCDEGFGNWAGFLAALSSRKRKALRKEREGIAKARIEIDWVTGSDITEAHLDLFWRFYQDTGARKWGAPYLTRNFFSVITERMADSILFVMARRGEQTIAGAMNFIGGDTLFGRYWGCTEYIPFLHFEVCYYQAIDYALQHGLSYVDAGAQGEHKIARGYQPVTTYSVHHLPNPSFHDAVARYLEAEREEVDEAIHYLQDFTPFRKDGA
ncbi:GNAT family N-acetyltransferase [Parvularcula marina]|uniref:N-acetyltransferase n=1 Tax=Parvularcula marina TaxID=2292771 RepID=A0A371RGV2_9PROT|nr:GNAT family N-acetyltransferase [Parvularcula marina]RFB04688.1 N-acetyltransferase [Parvularcula marina]